MEGGLSLRSNWYDLMRLLLALGVVFTHSYAVGGFGEEPLVSHTKEKIILGSICVLGFFGLSGFLVSGSYENSKTQTSFFIKRFRRIFPGFWVCLAATAFIIGPLIGVLNNIPIEKYPFTGQEGAFEYLKSNFFISINQHNIGEIIEKTAWPGSLNGSLWSLHPEIVCYIALGVLGACGAFTNSKWLLFFSAFFLVGFHFAITLFEQEIFPKAPSFLVFSKNTPYIAAFFVGACIYRLRDDIEPTVGNIIFLTLLTCLFLKFGGFKLVAPIIIPALLLIAGSKIKIILKNDFSYGVYIYSFPIQQLIYSSKLVNTSVIAFCIVSCVLSLGAAYLSWKIIEKPLLHRSRTT